MQKNKDYNLDKHGNRVYLFEQRSEQWLKVKAGVISSSCSDKIMKSRGLGVGGETYCFQLVAQLLKKHFEPTYVSAAMRKGIDREPLAKEQYEQEKLTSVNEVGFVVYYTEDENLKHLNGFIGVSPDGLIGLDGGLEIKCPEEDQHTKNLSNHKEDLMYIDQIQTCLFVTRRKCWDLMTYNPDFKEGFKWKITRFYPDLEWQKKFITRATQCKTKVLEITEKIKNK